MHTHRTRNSFGPRPHSICIFFNSEVMLTYPDKRAHNVISQSSRKWNAVFDLISGFGQIMLIFCWFSVQRKKKKSFLVNKSRRLDRIDIRYGIARIRMTHEIIIMTSLALPLYHLFWFILRFGEYHSAGHFFFRFACNCKKNQAIYLFFWARIMSTLINKINKVSSIFRFL